MKLAAWARANGVHPQTAYRWFRQATLPVPACRLPSGTILVEMPASSGAPDRPGHADPSDPTDRDGADR